MNSSMTVRGKTYCQVEPAIWQQCPQVGAMAVSGGGGEILVILALAAVGATLAVLPTYLERLGAIEADTEIIRRAMD